MSEKVETELRNEINEVRAKVEWCCKKITANRDYTRRLNRRVCDRIKKTEVLQKAIRELWTYFYE